jgi:hypothetical protein
MTTEATAHPNSDTAGGSAVATSSVLLLVFAVGQVISPVFSALLGGSFTTADRAGEPPITPAGYTFSIWGLIELFSLAYAIWALWARRRVLESDRALIDRLAVPLTVVFAGFSAWLVAAELEPTWATLAVFLIMIAGLLRAMSVALEGRATIGSWPKPGRWLLWGTLGLYTGWSSIAIWLNLTTGLAGSGAPITGTVGFLGQLAILAGAVATAAAILRWTGGLLPYAVAVVWALIGATVGATGGGEPGLAIAAVVGLGVVVVVTIGEQLFRRRATAADPS